MQLLTLIALAVLAVVAVSLLAVWLFPPQPPRRYTGKLKRSG